MTERLKAICANTKNPDIKKMCDAILDDPHNDKPAPDNDAPAPENNAAPGSDWDADDVPKTCNDEV